MKIQLTLLIPIVFLAAGCSLDHLARRQMARMTLDVVSAYDRETDLELAQSTLAASLKILEGAMISDSSNTALLTATARGYSRYAWGFIEPELEQAQFDGDSAKVSSTSTRAAEFYRRAREFGLRALPHKNSGFELLEKCELAAFYSLLQKLDSTSAEALYWTAFAWGNLLRFQPVSCGLPSHLAKVRRMIERVIELGNSEYAVQAHTFLGAYYASLPTMLGHNIELAKKYLEKGVELSQGKFLPARLSYARYYQFLIGDKEGYKATLQEIVNTSAGSNQSHALDNAVAKSQARKLLERCRDI